MLPLLFASLLACAETPVDSVPVAVLELGLGLSAFTEAQDGDPAILVHGPQGGWHVDVALRAQGLDPEGALLRYEGRDGATGALISYATEASLNADRVTPTEAGWQRLGDRVVFDVPSAADVAGRSVQLSVSASVGGESYYDEVVVEVVDEGG